MRLEELAGVLDRVRKTGRLPDGTRACLLCGDACPHEAMFVGLWFPSKTMQKRIGCSEERLRNGGSRIVIYQLCAGCMENPTSTEDVEDALLKQAGVQ